VSGEEGLRDYLNWTPGLDRSKADSCVHLRMGKHVQLWARRSLGFIACFAMPSLTSYLRAPTHYSTSLIFPVIYSFPSYCRRHDNSSWISFCPFECQTTEQTRCVSCWTLNRVLSIRYLNCISGWRPTAMMRQTHGATMNDLYRRDSNHSQSYVAVRSKSSVYHCCLV